jgi:hypothetical protein
MTALTYPYNNYIILHAQNLPVQIEPSSSQPQINRELSAESIFDQAIKHGNNVKVISLGISGNRTFSMPYLRTFIENCTECEELNLKFCEFIDDSQLELIAGICQSTKIKKINLSSLPKITANGLLFFNYLELLKTIQINSLNISHQLSSANLSFKVDYQGCAGYEEGY